MSDSHTVIANKFLIIRTTCPSEAFTVCIGLSELIGNRFGRGFELGFVTCVSRLQVELISPAELKPDKLAIDRPLHLKYRKCTIFLTG